jgi:hypothetical protein
VAVAAKAGAAVTSASASTTGRIMSLRRARDDPLLVIDLTAACGLPEAMTLVRVMPTSHSWSGERCDPVLGPSGDLSVDSNDNAPFLASGSSFSGGSLPRKPSSGQKVYHQ